MTSPHPSSERASSDSQNDVQEARAPAQEVEILDVVCHDLKDPLAAILMGSAFLLKTLPEDPANARVRKMVAAMKRSADRMNGVVKNMLDFARLERGRVTLRRGVHEIGAILADASKRLSVGAADRDVRVVVEVEEPSRRVTCDIERVVDAICQLGANAVRYTPRGQAVTLRARADDACASFSVVDHGPGISGERRDHLFEPRYHMHQMPRDGTGLGLSIARGIALAHGGDLTLEDTGPHGSTFRITIPAQ